MSSPAATITRPLEPPPGRTLCAHDPAAWDIPNIDDKTDERTIRHRVADVLEACDRCPALAWCQQQAVDNPPAHHCVQGGLIWPGQDPALARRRDADRPVPYAKWKPPRRSPRQAVAA